MHRMFAHTFSAEAFAETAETPLSWNASEWIWFSQNYKFVHLSSFGFQFPEHFKD